MLAKHGHTEAKSTERQQHISELDTENTTSISFFVQNMETGFAECFFFFSGFFNILTAYKVMQRKQCRQQIPADAPRLPFHIRVRPGEEGARERDEEEEGGSDASPRLRDPA